MMDILSLIQTKAIVDIVVFLIHAMVFSSTPCQNEFEADVKS